MASTGALLLCQSTFSNSSPLALAVLPEATSMPDSSAFEVADAQHTYLSNLVGALYGTVSAQYNVFAPTIAHSNNGTDETPLTGESNASPAAIVLALAGLPKTSLTMQAGPGNPAQLQHAQ
jgi:hypothetical protein